MIDKYYLLRHIYSDSELTSNVYRFSDDPLGVIIDFFASDPKPRDQYTDDDWGRLYDKRVDDIDKAMRAYISAGGPYEGDDVVSLIDQYNTILQRLKFARAVWIEIDARHQIDWDESFKSFLRNHLDVIDMEWDALSPDEKVTSLP